MVTDCWKEACLALLQSSLGLDFLGPPRKETLLQFLEDSCHCLRDQSEYYKIRANRRNIIDPDQVKYEEERLSRRTRMASLAFLAIGH